MQDVDYEATMAAKLSIAKKVFAQEKDLILNSSSFKQYFLENEVLWNSSSYVYFSIMVEKPKTYIFFLSSMFYLIFYWSFPLYFLDSFGFLTCVLLDERNG